MSSEESDLTTYQLQLQQVEAALTTDPTNEELIQLKSDLEQVIELTQELISANSTTAHKDEDEELESAFSSKEKKKRSRWAEAAPVLPVRPWQVGETCQALYSGDGQMREAVIEEISADGDVTVRFKGVKGTFITSLSSLKLPSSGMTTVHAESKSKREMDIKRKEYLKEKKKKKLEKMKEMEASREKEKHKWQNFSTKAFGKKGFVKKSIFKTPESCEGKVGVGTCGIAGQGMTEFTHAQKYRKTL